MDIVDLIDEGYRWTAKRVAAIRAGDLDAPTPCAEWDLRQLVDHLLTALTRHLNAVSGTEEVRPDPAEPVAAFGLVAARAAEVWQTPGVLERACALSFGPISGSTVAGLSLMEVVVHGWDIARARGERVVIPAHLAEAALDFATGFVTDAFRGTAFGPELSTGDTPAERLLAFLGHRP